MEELTEDLKKWPSEGESLVRNNNEGEPSDLEPNTEAEPVSTDTLEDLSTGGYWKTSGKVEKGKQPLIEADTITQSEWSGDKAGNRDLFSTATLGGISIDKEDQRNINKIIPKHLLQPLARTLLREAFAYEKIPSSTMTEWLNTSQGSVDKRHMSDLESNLSLLTHKVVALEAQVKTLIDTTASYAGKTAELVELAADLVREADVDTIGRVLGKRKVEIINPELELSSTAAGIRATEPTLRHAADATAYTQGTRPGRRVEDMFSL